VPDFQSSAAKVGNQCPQGFLAPTFGEFFGTLADQALEPFCLLGLDQFAGKIGTNKGQDVGHGFLAKNQRRGAGNRFGQGGGRVGHAADTQVLDDHQTDLLGDGQEGFRHRRGRRKDGIESGFTDPVEFGLGIGLVQESSLASSVPPDSTNEKGRFVEKNALFHPRQMGESERYLDRLSPVDGKFRTVEGRMVRAPGLGFRNLEFEFMFGFGSSQFDFAAEFALLSIGSDQTNMKLDLGLGNPWTETQCGANPVGLEIGPNQYVFQHRTGRNDDLGGFVEDRPQVQGFAFTRRPRA
jgi:hypothetical protein